MAVNNKIKRRSTQVPATGTASDWITVLDGDDFAPAAMVDLVQTLIDDVTTLQTEMIAEQAISTTLQNEMTEAQLAVNPPGTIIHGGWTSAPPGYLLLDGTTHVNGVIDYPTIASLFGDWVSGSDLQMPNVHNRVLQGSTGSPGLEGGSSTIGNTNLPNHSHTIANHDHNHGLGMNAGNVSGGVTGTTNTHHDTGDAGIEAHTHTVGSHKHNADGGNNSANQYVLRISNANTTGGSKFYVASGNSSTGGANAGGWHTHTQTSGLQVDYSVNQTGGSTVFSTGNYNANAGSHQHNVDGHNHAHNFNVNAGTITGSVTANTTPNSTGNTNNSGTSFYPAHITIRMAVKY